MPVGIALAFILLLLCAAARAGDCQIGAALDEASALAEHLRREAACHGDADFLLRLGTLLNLAGRHAEAAERLEAALLRAPDDGRIKLEYAIALAGSGDTPAAFDLLAQLRRDPSLDDEARRQIARLIETASKRAWLPSGSLALVIGHDDNLSGVAHQGPFALTLPEGTLIVEPLGGQKPRAGLFYRADLQLKGQLPGNAATPPRWQLFASQRQTPGQDADRLHWGLMLEKNDTWLAGDDLQLGLQQLTLASADLYRQLHLSIGHTAAFVLPTLSAPCRRRIGLEWQRRDYPQAEILAGDYLGLQLSAFCPESAWQGAIKLGRDQPRSQGRPGGAQSQAALSLGHSQPLGRGLLHLEAEWSWQRDATGYSPLLENGRVRTLRRSLYRFEYHWAASSLAPLRPFVSFSSLTQRANLPLFSLRNDVLAFGLAYAW